MPTAFTALFTDSMTPGFFDSGTDGGLLMYRCLDA